MSATSQSFIIASPVSSKKSSPVNQARSPAASSYVMQPRSSARIQHAPVASGPTPFVRPLCPPSFVHRRSPTFSTVKPFAYSSFNSSAAPLRSQRTHPIASFPSLFPQRSQTPSGFVGPTAPMGAFQRPPSFVGPRLESPCRSTSRIARPTYIGTHLVVPKAPITVAYGQHLYSGPRPFTPSACYKPVLLTRKSSCGLRMNIGSQNSVSPGCDRKSTVETPDLKHASENSLVRVPSMATPIPKAVVTPASEPKPEEEPISTCRERKCHFVILRGKNLLLQEERIKKDVVKLPGILSIAIYEFGPKMAANLGTRCSEEEEERFKKYLSTLFIDSTIVPSIELERFASKYGQSRAPSPQKSPREPREFVLTPSASASKIGHQATGKEATEIGGVVGGRVLLDASERDWFDSDPEDDAGSEVSEQEEEEEEVVVAPLPKRKTLWEREKEAREQIEAPKVEKPLLKYIDEQFTSAEIKGFGKNSVSPELLRGIREDTVKRAKALKVKPGFYLDEFGNPEDALKAVGSRGENSAFVTFFSSAMSTFGVARTEHLKGKLAGIVATQAQPKEGEEMQRPKKEPSQGLWGMWGGKA